jgi:hypothetical protein
MANLDTIPVELLREILPLAHEGLMDHGADAKTRRAAFKTRIAIEATYRSLPSASLTLPWFGKGEIACVYSFHGMCPSADRLPVDENDLDVHTSRPNIRRVNELQAAFRLFFVDVPARLLTIDSFELASHVSVELARRTQDIFRNNGHVLDLITTVTDCDSVFAKRLSDAGSLTKGLRLRYLTMPGVPQMNPGRLEKAIAGHKGTLEVFELDFWTNDPSNVPHDHKEKVTSVVDAALRGLEGSTSMKELKVRDVPGDGHGLLGEVIQQITCSIQMYNTHRYHSTGGPGETTQRQSESAET